jgi:hypothetical protein
MLARRLVGDDIRLAETKTRIRVGRRVVGSNEVSETI